MTTTLMIFVPRSAGQPARTLLIDPSGASTGPDLVLDGAPPPAADRTVAVVSGADVLVRWVDLAPGAPAQLRAAVLWMLRNDLAVSPDRLVVSLGPPTARGEPRLAAVAGSALVEAWVDWLASLGVSPDVLLPDSLVPPEPEEGLHVREGEGETVVRGPRLAATVQSDLASLMTSGRTTTSLSDAEWRRALTAAATAPAVNLLVPTGGGGEQRRGGWRLAIGLAAALALSPLVLLTSSGLRDASAEKASRSRALAAIERHDPALAATPDAIQTVIGMSDAALPAGGVPGAAAALYTALEGVAGAELDAMSADPAYGLRATLSYAAFQDLDAVKAAMAGLGYEVSDDSTVEDSGRVVSEIRIGAGR